MKTFNDNAGRTWTIAVTVDAVKRVRDLLEEDLLDVKQILERLMIDPILLCDVVYCASGSKRGEDDWEITFRFAASPNVTGLTVGDIQNIDKKGWEYLWVRYADDEDDDAKVLVKRPIAAYVERVYEDGDLSGLGIGV